LFTRNTLRGGPISPAEIVDSYINANRSLFGVKKNLKADMDAARLLNINETIVNKRISDTLNKLAFVSMSFAPATFVAGLYGMNFQYGVIPPWNSPHGFLLAIIIIIIVTVFSVWIINYITLK